MQLAELAEEDDGMKHLLLCELVAGEVRAQRSLRVMEHQESRLAVMENNLSNQSLKLNELQEDNSDLLEVHKQQLEVQDLQRELIKLQEIQYLTRISNMELGKGSVQGDKSPKSRKVEEVMTPSSPLSLGKDNLATTTLKSPRSSVPEQRRSTPPPPPSPGGNSTRKNKSPRSNKSNKNPDLIADKNRNMKGHGSDSESANNEDVSYFQKLKQNFKSLDSYLIGKGEGQKDQSYEQNQKTSKNSRTNRGSESLKKSIYTKTGRREIRDEDDMTEKITILRERLSSHRQSIDSLSGEIIDLRQERIELLTYLKTLLDWKVKVEKSLKTVGINLDISKTPSSLMNQNRNLISDTRAKLEQNKRRMSLSVPPFVMSNNDNDTIPATASARKPKDKSLTVEDSKLGERASQLWDLACKFFTPTQAHFILTAPIPSGDGLESSEEEA